MTVFGPSFGYICFLFIMSHLCCRLLLLKAAAFLSVDRFANCTFASLSLLSHCSVTHFLLASIIIFMMLLFTRLYCFGASGSSFLVFLKVSSDHKGLGCHQWHMVCFSSSPFLALHLLLYQYLLHVVSQYVNVLKEVKCCEFATNILAICGSFRFSTLNLMHGLLCFICFFILSLSSINSIL